MNAFEAKRISDAANHKNSEDIASDILNRNLKCGRDGDNYRYGCGDCRRKFWGKGIE